MTRTFAQVRDAARYLLDPPEDVQAERLEEALEQISEHLGIQYAGSSTGVWLAVGTERPGTMGPYGSRLEAQYSAVALHLNRILEGGS